MTFLAFCLAFGQSALTTGVHSVPTAGSPGLVVPISMPATTFLVGGKSKSPRSVAVQSTLGKGKVVAFARTSYLSPEILKQGDMRALFQNILTWFGAKKVGLVSGQINPSFLQDFSQVETVVILPNLAHAELQKLDTVVLYDTTNIRGLEDFVKSGGNVIMANTPWGWMSLNPGKTLSEDLSLNHLLTEAGAVFTDGSTDSIRPATAEESTSFNASEALVRISQKTSLAQDSDTVMEALRALPRTQPLWTKTREVIKGVNAIPTSKQPILATDGPGRLSILLNHLEGTYKAGIDPAASNFPGLAPADAPRTSKFVDIRTDVNHWASTGTYASAGETVTLHVPADLVDKGLELQIGVHSDNLWGLPKWERHPSIVTKTPIKSKTTMLSSPFGGLVVIVINKPLNLAKAPVMVQGIVPSARFVLGETTPEAWKTEVEKPAPWAELESKNLIFSVPIDELRKVKDPEKLMKLWDHCLELFDKLDGNGQKPRPERIVCDRQISAGYMHSGYPIMTWMDKSVPLSLDYDKLTTDGTWGHWHELGHNRQKPAWTFSGAGEVTNNLFTLYGMAKVAGKPVDDRIKQNKKDVDKYFADGAKFDDWKAKPFVALTMYAELIEAFGWEGLQKTFRTYRDGVRPKDDLEKHDQWMIRYSKVVGKNLAPFFTRWGFPVSEAAKAEISSMPAWNGK